MPSTNSLSCAEAARILGISRQAILYFEKRGRLAVVRVDGGAYVPVAHVERLAKERRASLASIGAGRRWQGSRIAKEINP